MLIEKKSDNLELFKFYQFQIKSIEQHSRVEEYLGNGAFMLVGMLESILSDIIQDNDLRELNYDTAIYIIGLCESLEKWTDQLIKNEKSELQYDVRIKLYSRLKLICHDLLTMFFDFRNGLELSELIESENKKTVA